MSSKIVNKTRLSALCVIAAAGGIVASSAAAIELGDIRVHSTIGQPLKASIAYALGPNESLSDFCVKLNPDRAASGLPSLTRADLSVGKGLITISGGTIINEPLLTLRLDIACPYTPRLSREYQMLLNPAGEAVAPVTPTAAAATRSAPARAPAQRDTVNASRPAPTTMALPEVDGNAYRVQPGDSLTRIAQAVVDRNVDVAVAARRIYAANPDAFIDGSADLIKAGSVLRIPDLGAATLATPTARAVPAPEPQRIADTVAATTAYEPGSGDAGSAYAPYQTPAREKPPVSAVAATSQPENAGAAALPAPDTIDAPAAQPDSAVSDTTTADAAAPRLFDEIDDTDVLEPVPPVDTESLRPGDVVLDDDSVYSAIRESNNVIDGEDMIRPATVEPTGSEARSISDFLPAPARRDSILFWLAVIGGGILSIAGLLWFWLRGHDDDAPRAVREPVIEDTPASEEALEAVAAPDYNLNDDSPTEENLALDESALEQDAPTLDADFDDGSGLKEATQGHATEDFGFAETTDLDFELPDEKPQVEEKPETDIIPPPQIEESSILKSEVLPEDEDYDMSVMLDATKMPQPEDVTEKDLKAVVVDAGDDTRNSDEYTVSRDNEFDILEQDYEDELSATQALNQEIDRAASQIARALETPEVEETGETKLDMLSELDVTEAFSTNDEPANDDADATYLAEPDAPDVSSPDDEATEIANLDDEDVTEVADLDATEVASLDEPEFADDAATEIADLDGTACNEAMTPEITEEDKTVEMPSDGEEKTVEMPRDDEDETVQMPKTSKNA